MIPPKRIAVVGCPGSGKSTLCKRLASTLKIPLVNLDSHYWLPRWKTRPTGQWKAIHDHLIQEETWIMDGTYNGSLLDRMKRTEVLIFLDPPLRVRIWRALRRAWFRKRKAEDLPAGCEEKMDWEFFHYILRFDFGPGHRIMELVREHPETTFIHLKSTQEIGNFNFPSL